MYSCCNLLVILKKTCTQVLESFLDARRAWVVSVLEAAAEQGPVPVQDLSTTLAKVSAQVQVFNLTLPLHVPQFRASALPWFADSVLKQILTSRRGCLWASDIFPIVTGMSRCDKAPMVEIHWKFIPCSHLHRLKSITSCLP